jgi:hypothetical protein
MPEDNKVDFLPPVLAAAELIIMMIIIVHGRVLAFKYCKP